MRTIRSVAMAAALTLTVAVCGTVAATPARASCLGCAPIHTQPRKAHPRDNPLTRKERRKLTRKQRAAIPDHLRHRRGFAKASPVIFSRQLAAAGMRPDTTWCGTSWFKVWVENVSGADLWYFRDTVTWCWNGTKVLSIGPPTTTVKVYSWASALGWEYNGIEDSAQWDYYHDKWVYATYRQGKFSFCPPRIFCVQTKYPWMYQYTYGSGAFGSGGFGA